MASPVRRALAAGVALAAIASGARAADVTRAPFGTMPDGRPVDVYTLRSDHGLKVRILTYGGIIQSVEVPDRHGKMADVVLGFGKLDDYVHTSADNNLFFGALIGRYANRIAHGTFTLDGQTYHVPVNLPPHTLHGGLRGFDKQLWTASDAGTTAHGASVTLNLVSPDGEQGFPGTLHASVTYTVDDTNTLSLRFRATTDKPTVVSLTSHGFWNLGGEGSGSVEGEEVRINADRFTPTDPTGIPTGELADVAGTPFDFRKPVVIGTRLRGSDPQLLMDHGYDKNFVVNGKPGGVPRLSVSVYDPASGRQLDLLTTQPGQQFYTSNGLDGRFAGISGETYRQTDALALEAEAFPDSPNHPAFPSAVLRPGQSYDETTIFRFSTR